MKKVIVILGSSRSDGNTRALVDLVFKNQEIELIDLNDYKIGYYDYNYENQNDDFLALANRILDFETVVFATPVYWYSMSAVLKTFFDRLSDLTRIHKKMGRAMAGKNLFYISCCDDEFPPEGYHVPFRETANYLDMNYGGNLHGIVGKVGLEQEIKDFVGKIF